MRTALVLCFLLAACGPKTKNQCASNTANNCVGGEQCSFDQKQGCQVCQCYPMDNEQKKDRFGGDNPDDRSLPPEPVH